MTTTTTANAAQRYHGTPASPLPPAGLGWALVHREDEVAMARAMEMERSAPLPLWHARDEMTEAGLYRFFRFDTPTGPATSALVYVGINRAIELADEEERAELGAMGAAAGPQDCGPGEVYVDNGDGTGDCYASAPEGPPDPAGGGQTTAYPTPPATAAVTAWTPDATNATATGIANTISYNNTPVAWTDQSIYYQTIAGVPWAFGQNWENGTKHVTAFRGTLASSPNQPPGTPPTNPAAPSTGISTGAVVAIVGVALAVTGGIIWAAVHH